MNEEQLENRCLDWFRNGGWDVLYGPAIASDGTNPQRNDYTQAILKSDLEMTFSRIKPRLPHECCDQVAP